MTTKALTKPRGYELVLAGRTIDGVFSDPPYNIKIEGVVSGNGKTRHRGFAMGVGEMSDDQFRTFLADYLERCKKHASKGAVIFACMDWRQSDLLMLAGRDAGLHRINKAIWSKGTAAWEASIALRTRKSSCSAPRLRPPSTMSFWGSTAGIGPTSGPIPERTSKGPRPPRHSGIIRRPSLSSLSPTPSEMLPSGAS